MSSERTSAYRHASDALRVSGSLSCELLGNFLPPTVRAVLLVAVRRAESLLAIWIRAAALGRHAGAFTDQFDYECSEQGTTLMVGVSNGEQLVSLSGNDTAIYRGNAQQVIEPLLQIANFNVVRLALPFSLLDGTVRTIILELCDLRRRRLSEYVAHHLAACVVEARERVLDVARV